MRLLATTASQPFLLMLASGAANCPPALFTSPSIRPVRVEGGACDPAGGVLVAMIAREGDRPATVVGDLRAHGLEPVRTPADQNDGRAEVRQLVRRAAADPAAAAGDDVGLAGKQAGTEYRVEGHGLLPWCGVPRLLGRAARGKWQGIPLLPSRGEFLQRFHRVLRLVVHGGNLRLSRRSLVTTQRLGR